MPGYYFLTMVLIANSGISQHSPAPGQPYSWDQCQKAGKFNAKNLVLRNVSITFYCSPTAGSVVSLPQDEDKK
jgi:hypothetical protein